MSVFGPFEPFSEELESFLVLFTKILQLFNRIVEIKKPEGFRFWNLQGYLLFKNFCKKSENFELKGT
jgi:hypothetical protein